MKWFIIIPLVVNSIIGEGIFSTQLVDQYAFFRRVVTFHCAINVSGYSLDLSAFNENGEVQPVDETSDDASALTGTFTLTQDNNGTRVICRAAAADFTFQISSAFAYGQDVPEVINPTATQTDCIPWIIATDWSIPALQPGLSVSYTVSVYLVDTAVSVHNVSTTTFTYHPTTGSGVYTIQVRAFNGTLTGDATNTTVEYYTDDRIDVTHISSRVSDSGKLWIYQLQLFGLCSIGPANVTVSSCIVDSKSTCYAASTYHGNVTIDDNGVVTADMDLPDEVTYNTSILMEYDSGLVLTSNEVITNTTSLQNATLLNTTSGGFCVEYNRVKENSISASIECSSRNASLQPATSESDTLYVRSCYDDIEPNIWTLYGCSGHVSCNIDNAVVSIRDINITNMTSTATSSSVFMTSTTTSPSPSVALPPSLISSTAIIAIVAVVPVTVVVLVINAVIIIIIIVNKYYRNKKIDSTPSYQTRNPSNGDGPLPNPSNGNYEIVPLAKQSQQQQQQQKSQETQLHYAQIGDLQKGSTVPSVNIALSNDTNETVYADIKGASYDKCPDTIKSKTIDSPPTQTELIAVLVPRLSQQWFAIGLALHLNPGQLKEVQDNRPDDRDGCLKDVLMMWEDNATDDKPYTWATMLHVLRSGKIGEKEFANYLLQNFSL